jgi:hypothetical protein
MFEDICTHTTENLIISTFPPAFFNFFLNLLLRAVSNILFLFDKTALLSNETLSPALSTLFL